MSRCICFYIVKEENECKRGERKIWKGTKAKNMPPPHKEVYPTYWQVRYINSYLVMGQIFRIKMFNAMISVPNVPNQNFWAKILAWVKTPPETRPHWQEPCLSTLPH